MNLFYFPEVTSDRLILDQEESRHCVKVLRMKTGDRLWLTDGKGSRYEAELAEASLRGCILRLTGHTHSDSPRGARLVMAVAPTRQLERFEWFLEKAVECGIDQVIPLLCDHSERSVLKPARFERILISAMKQSLRSRLPLLHPLTPFSKLLTMKAQFPGMAFMAHCASAEKKALHAACPPGHDALIMVGPEGDFSSDEISMAMQAGVQAIGLGNYRLRTETASVALCVQFNSLNGLL